MPYFSAISTGVSGYSGYSGYSGSTGPSWGVLTYASSSTIEDLDTGTATLLRLTDKGDLGGIVGAGSGGRHLVIYNGYGGKLYLIHEDTSSASDNRFSCPGGTDFTIYSNELALVVYDDVDQRWRVKA